MPSNLEITKINSKNIILNLAYRRLNDEEFEKHLNKILLTNDILQKKVIMASNFNMNLRDFE